MFKISKIFSIIQHKTIFMLSLYMRFWQDILSLFLYLEVGGIFYQVMTYLTHTVLFLFIQCCAFSNPSKCQNKKKVCFHIFFFRAQTRNDRWGYILNYLLNSLVNNTVNVYYMLYLLYLQIEISLSGVTFSAI